MTLKRFRHLAEAYGADLARWPAADREAARALAASSPDAAALVAEERALDDLLRRAAADAPGDAETERMLRAIEERVDRMAAAYTVAPPGFVAIPRRFRAAGLLAAMAVAGFLVGNVGLARLYSASTAVADDGFHSLSVSPSLRDLWNR